MDNKILRYGALLFVLFLIYNSPSEAAGFADGFGGFAVQMLDGIGQFLTGLFNGAGGT